MRMDVVAILQVLALVAVANGTPIVAKKIFGARFATPLDGGIALPDGRALFGPSKTIRGVVAAILVTALGAPVVGLAPGIGALIAGTAMAGDLVSSFCKRRLGLRSSSRALGLDQVPESLFPLLACRDLLSLTTADIALGVGIFFVGELVLSRILYKIHLRDEPY